MTIDPIVGGGVVVFFRTIGILAILPIGQELTQIIQRIMIAVGVALFIGPSVSVTQMDLTVPISEAVIGIIIGLPCAVIVNGAGMLGALFDSGRGESIGQVVDPLNNEPHSFTGILFSQGSWVVLLSLGILERLLVSLYDSFQIILPAHGLNLGEGVGSHLLIFLGALLGNIFAAYIPFGVLFVCVDFGLGFASKLLPRVSFDREIFQIKSALGFLLLIVLCRSDIGQTLLSCALPRFELFHTGS